jgi:hypothetical protein
MDRFELGLYKCVYILQPLSALMTQLSGPGFTARTHFTLNLPPSKNVLVVNNTNLFVNNLPFLTPPTDHTFVWPGRIDASRPSSTTDVVAVPSNIDVPT